MKETIMKRPSKPPPPPPPPPPPLPPRPSRLRQSTGSEYADSVCSTPCQSLQPRVESSSPAWSYYWPCKSEQAYRPVEMNPTRTCCLRNFNAPSCCSIQSIAPSCCSGISNPPSCCSGSSYYTTYQQVHCSNQLCVPQIARESSPCKCASESGATPKPKERIIRPRLSISPMPELRGSVERPKLKCKSLHYRRHIEQHVERVFKYLKEREQRLLERKAQIKHGMDPQTAETLLTVSAKQESMHLRSLRARMSPADFEIIKGLGSGYMGHVSLVRKIPKDHDPDSKLELYAMKKLKKLQVFQQDHVAHVMAERDILAEADNEWIVKLFYSFQDEQHLYFILEYVPGGDLMHLLQQYPQFSESWGQFYIAEISLALQFVHDLGFIHRDIKPDNILIDAKGHIKLTDFGLCTGFRWTHDSKYYRDDTINSTNGNNNFQDHPTITKALTEREIDHALRKRPLSLVGSPNYIAPEVLRQMCGPQEIDNEKLCDWWSVGVILYEMVIGYCPFIDVDRLNDGTYKQEDDPPVKIQQRIIQWRDYLKIPPNIHGFYISEATRDLIMGLLCDPEKRLCQNGIRDIMGHKFFEDIDWNNIRQSRAPYVPEFSDAYDTKYFDSQSIYEPEGQLDPGASMGPINDFTYHNFRFKPRQTS